MEITLYKKSGIYIPKEYSHRQFYEQIKQYLTRRVKGFNQNETKTYYFYLESDKGLLIPEYFPIQQFINKDRYEIIDKTTEPEKININHHIIPRNETQIRALDQLRSANHKILQLPPGVGKSIIMIHYIAELSYKSIILVHRESLANQWKSRFIEFTDVGEGNISRLTSNSFKEDLKKPIIISTVQAFLAILRNHRLEFLKELNKSNIGVCVSDESHILGAKSFSEVMLHISAKHKYGLSATPFRYDKNEDIIQYHIGEIYSDSDSSGTMDARVNMILIDYKIDTHYRRKYLYWSGVFQRSRYLNIMKNSKNFMACVKSLINKFKGDRNLLVIAERVKKMIDILYDWVEYDDKSRFCAGDDEKALDASLIFSSPSKFRDGIDNPKLDCLIITSPVGNIEQLTGRIIRIKEGKQQPIIIDMVDIGCERIRSTVFKRLEYYNSKNWEIKFIYFNDENKPEIISEENAMEFLNGK